MRLIIHFYVCLAHPCKVSHLFNMASVYAVQKQLLCAVKCSSLRVIFQLLSVSMSKYYKRRSRLCCLFTGLYQVDSNSPCRSSVTALQVVNQNTQNSILWMLSLYPTKFIARLAV